MKEPVIIQHDDDVEVLNRPAAEEYYSTRGPPIFGAASNEEMWMSYPKTFL